MTKGEIETLRTILRFGGRVLLTMGRMSEPHMVRTSLVNRLGDRGFVREWSTGCVDFQGGRVRDLAVTAEGCRALANAEAE